MYSVKLKINYANYDKLLWLLSKFDKSDIEVTREPNTFEETQLYLSQELEEIKGGNAIFLEYDEMDAIIENTIRNY